jgi:hypothetical protein
MKFSRMSRGAVIAGLMLILAAAIRSAAQHPRAGPSSAGGRVLFMAQVAEQPNRLDSNQGRPPD